MLKRVWKAVKLKDLPIDSENPLQNSKILLQSFFGKKYSKTESLRDLKYVNSEQRKELWRVDGDHFFFS